MTHTNGADPLVVRADEVAPLIELWITRYEVQKGMTHGVTGSNRGASSKTSSMGRGDKVDTLLKPMGAVACLEYHSGVPARRIWSIRSGESKHVTLTVADRLLTFMDDAPNCYRDGRVTIIPNPRWSNEKYQAYLAETGRQCATEAG